jgi:hypothetical protein
MADVQNLETKSIVHSPKLNVTSPSTSLIYTSLQQQACLYKLSKKHEDHCCSQAWRCTPVITALGRLRQDGKFKVNLDYIVRIRPAPTTY